MMIQSLKKVWLVLVAFTTLNVFAQQPAVPTYTDPYKMMEVLADNTFQRIAR